MSRRGIKGEVVLDAVGGGIVCWVVLVCWLVGVGGLYL